MSTREASPSSTSESFTEIDNFATETSFMNNVFETLATTLSTYYTPFLIFLGVVGNLISVYVFFKSKLRLQSTTLYLSALAISDTVFLLQLLPVWLSDIQLTGLFHRAVFCQIFIYVSYVTCFLSAWLVVAFTVERFVAVLYPLRRNLLCTTARARYVIMALVVVALLLYAPMIKFTSSSVAASECNINYDYYDLALRFNLIDTALSFTVPLAMIIVLNTWIMVGICRIQRARRQLVRSGGSDSSDWEARVAPPLASRSQHRITQMLLIVSSVFVALNLPAYTMRILAYAYNTKKEDRSGYWASMTQLGQMSFNTNFGINFILYCLSGQNFRRALGQAIPLLRHRTRRPSTPPTVSTRPARGSSVSTLSCIEAPNTSASVAGSARRHRSEPVIKRWTFDNSRQRRPETTHPEEELGIEMSVYVPPHTTENIICPQQSVRSLPENRAFPYLLFPYRNLIVARNRRPDIVNAVLYP